MTTPRTNTFERVQALLRDRPMTLGEISQLTGVQVIGIKSTLIGVMKRREVKRTMRDGHYLFSLSQSLNEREGI